MKGQEKKSRGGSTVEHENLDFLLGSVAFVASVLWRRGAAGVAGCCRRHCSRVNCEGATTGRG